MKDSVLSLHYVGPMELNSGHEVWWQVPSISPAQRLFMEIPLEISMEMKTIFKVWKN